MTEHLALDGSSSTHFMHILLENREHPVIRFSLQQDLTEIDFHRNCTNLLARGHSNSASGPLIPNVPTPFRFLSPMRIFHLDIEFPEMNTAPTTAGPMLLHFMHMPRSKEVEITE